MARKIAFIDVETTSLHAEDPRTLVLEVAALVTDMDLTEIARESVVVAWTPAEVEAALWDPVARAMHEANGLLVDVVSSRAVSLLEAERRLVEALGVDLERSPDRPGFGAEGPEAPLWGGCSPWLDRTIVRRLMPGLYSRIHYRSLDATSLKLALEAWAGEVPARAERPHRALPDAIAARDLALHCRRVLRRAPVNNVMPMVLPVDAQLVSA